MCKILRGSYLRVEQPEADRADLHGSPQLGHGDVDLVLGANYSIVIVIVIVIVCSISICCIV